MQVGSKNAAFYMGRSIKVATKSAESQYVHELGIAAERLEQRYKGGEVKSTLQVNQSSAIRSMLNTLEIFGYLFFCFFMGFCNVLL